MNVQEQKRAKNIEANIKTDHINILILKSFIRKLRHKSK